MNKRSPSPGRGADLDAILSSAPARRLPGRNFTKADILFYGRPGDGLAVKDYSARSWPLRRTLGRWLLRREARAYEAVSGIEGLPRFRGRPGPFALAVEWIDGRPLAEFGGGRLGERVFDRLAAIVAAAHARGVALGDLHHRDVLVRKDGAVFVVDLATAWVVGERPGLLRRRLFRRLSEQDRIAVARLRARLTGGDVEAAIDAFGPRAARRYRRARAVKRWWNRLRGRRG